MDALSIISRNTAKEPGQIINEKVAETVKGIQSIRGETKSIELNTFEQTYGGKRAEARKKEIQAKKNKSNDKTKTTDKSAIKK